MWLRDLRLREDRFVHLLREHVCWTRAFVRRVRLFGEYVCSTSMQHLFISLVFIVSVRVECEG
jgi:hypothetical protein